jgi:hypothetical protein
VIAIESIEKTRGFSTGRMKKMSRGTALADSATATEEARFVTRTVARLEVDVTKTELEAILRSGRVRYRQHIGCQLRLSIDDLKAFIDQSTSGGR